MLRYASKAVNATLAFALLTALAVFIVVPRATGGMTFTILSGSMEPAFDPGDIVIAGGYSASTELSIGDVIVFLPYPDDPTLVTHRIVGMTAGDEGASYVTKGDNNDTNDPWGPVRTEQIRGVALFRIPKAGYLTSWLGPHGPTIGLGLAIGLLCYAAVAFIIASRRARTTKLAATAARRGIEK